ncbi:MAG: hypothetical protein ABFD69_06725 [Candidatus Sumerlaeia bacterium]
MEKVLSIRRQILGCMLAMMILAGQARAQAPQPVDPEAGKITISTGMMEPSKATKLNESLESAAREFREANFSAAADWYEAALKLDPTITEARSKQSLARQLDQAQQAARKDLPAGKRERDRFLASSFRTATKFYNDQQFDKASQAFYTMWLTAGDYQGKTLKMYADARSRVALGQSAAPEAPVAVAAAPAAQNGDAPLAAAPASGDAVAKAREAAAAGKPEEARKALNDVLVREPLNQQARVELNKLSKPVVGTASLASATAGSPSDPATQLEVSHLLAQAGKSIDEGKLDEANRQLARVFELSPDNPQARDLMAKMTAKGFDPSERIQALMAIGDKLMLEKRWSDAIANYEQVLQLDPKHRQATIQLAKAQREQGYAAQGEKQRQKVASAVEIDSMLKAARAAYNNKDLAKARELWTRVIEADPANKDAKTWLEETEQAWAAQQATAAEKEGQKARSLESEKLLNTPIKISTDREIPLSDFMYLLSITTPVELEYYIAQGADVPVMANFTDKSLCSILDTVLPPKGLSWSINDKNVITIEQKVDMRTMKLSPGQMSQVRSLLDQGLLQQNVWGQATPPSPNVEIKLDERLNLLIVAGSPKHIQAVESFLKSVPASATPDLDTRIYKIRPDDAQRIQALISTLIQTDAQSPFALERKVFTQGDDLIIRDTPENLTKIEELLLDKKFIQKLANEELQIANYSLVPREVEQIQSDYIQDFTARVVEAIGTFLYSQVGTAKAAAEGRRMWFDDSTLQLTIVDYPSNLDQVRKYIDSLPELRKGDQQDVIFLQYAESDTLQQSLERILNLTTGVGGGGGGIGQEMKFTLTRGQQREVAGGATFRLIRVEQNDVQDKNDDTAQISINVPGMGPQSTTVQELETQTVNDYEITAEDVLPSSGINGEGQARLSVRYIPQMIAQQLQQARTSVMPGGQFGGMPNLTGAPAEDQGITINSFTELNAIILRFTNPELHTEAVNLIKQLDKPTRQVEIETKFVEVNETRAKEFSSDFTFDNFSEGNGVDWDTQLINTRFAQDSDEFRDPFSPLIEDLNSANLMKGTTAVSMIFGGFPQLKWNLRLLEAEGILNIVNGPRVTALHGINAEFRIEQYMPESQGDLFQNDLVTIDNPLLESMNTNLELSTQDETENDNMLTAVVLQVTPSITSDKNIILHQLTAEILDLDQNIGSLAVPDVAEPENVTQTNYYNGQIAPQAVVNQGLYSLKRKKIITDARISNGGTIVLGGWTGERSTEDTSGIPVLRNMPYLGKLLFSRAQRNRSRTTLLIFLTGWIVNPE